MLRLLPVILGQMTVTVALKTTCTIQGGVVPTLFILGAQKSGTTTLWTDSNRHLQGLQPPVIPQDKIDVEPKFFSKELHFFDSIDRYKEGQSLYSSYYPRCNQMKKEHKFAAEATPNYFSPEGHHGGTTPWERCDRFFAENTEHIPGYTSGREDLVFVVILRKPEERLLSQYHHFCVREKSKTSWCNMTILEYVKSINVHVCNVSNPDFDQHCPDIPYKSGFYWWPLSGWVERFPRSHFIVTTYSQYFSDPSSVIKEMALALNTTKSEVGRPAQANRFHQAKQKGENEALELLRLMYKDHNDFTWQKIAEYQSSPLFHFKFIGTMGEF